jgi:hypothetical protein
MAKAGTSRGFLRVTVDSREVDAILLRGQMAVSTPSLAFFLKSSVEPYLQGRARDRFTKQGDEVTGAWEALKPSTQSIREALGYNPTWPINVRTGALEDYVTNTPGTITGGAGAAVLTLPGASATGELADKVATAQGGKEAMGRRGSTPPRPVLAMGVQDLEGMMVLLSAYMMRVLSGGRLGVGT